jgi:hypothetical protein
MLLTWKLSTGDPDGDIEATFRGMIFEVIRSGASAKAYARTEGGSDDAKPLSSWTTPGAAIAICENAASALPAPLMDLIDKYAQTVHLGKLNSTSAKVLRAEIARRVAELKSKAAGR